MVIPEPAKWKQSGRFSTGEPTRQLSAVHSGTLCSVSTWSQLLRSSAILELFDEFCAILDSSLFHLYDTRVKAKVAAFREVLAQALSHPENYEPSRRAGQYVFTASSGRPLNEDEIQDLKVIDGGIAKLRP